jgi:hypothetical protein
VVDGRQRAVVQAVGFDPLTFQPGDQIVERLFGHSGQLTADRSQRTAHSERDRVPVRERLRILRRGVAIMSA